jgi:hypothetical protein
MSDDHFVDPNDENAKRHFDGLMDFVRQRNAEVEMREHFRTTSVDRKDNIGMRLHMVNAHQFTLEDLNFTDEDFHSDIPSISARMKAHSKEGIMPALSDTDIEDWHEHEHTHGEYAGDYETEDRGRNHRHL